MTDSDVLATDSTAGHDSSPARSRGRAWNSRLAYTTQRFSGLGLIAALSVVFWIWEPQTFGTAVNVRVLLSSQAITGIITLGLIVSLISGVFDLSVAANMSLAITVVGKLQASGHVNAALAVILTLAVGALVGCANALIITRFHIDPVIGTLAMSSVLAAVSYWIASGQSVVQGISPGFTRLGAAKPLGIPVSVIYLFVLALLLWFLLDHTPAGRYLYAIGGNPDAALLSGVRVVRLKWMALIVSGVTASIAGVVLTMQLGSASFGAGDSYLLPAFATAFLGSTQIVPKRFNVWGTVVALYLLAVGVQGIQLRFPSYSWIQELVQGVILLLAVGIASRSPSTGRVIRGLARGIRRPRAEIGPVDAPQS